MGRWRYTGFYGCPERERRRESLEMLRYLYTQSNLPCLIIGDFNDMMFRDEKRGSRAHSSGLLQGFTEVVNECGLRYMGFVGDKFTWEKSMGKHNWIQERLDRV